MTLLEDVNRVIESVGYDDYVDVEDVAIIVGATVEEDRIHLGERRWGSNVGAVLCRGLNGQFEYVMITTYIYSGDSDGPNDAEAKEVKPRHITSTVWDKV